MDIPPDTTVIAYTNIILPTSIKHPLQSIKSVKAITNCGSRSIENRKRTCGGRHRKHTNLLHG
jgi:hypothetical protein